MSELRKDPVVERWVIITDDPLRSPAITSHSPGLHSDGPCPFCPGNEHLCPPEILANRPQGSQPNDARWNLRVIPNRSPLLTIEEDYKRLGEGLYDKITGVGANEVIIETPRHDIRQSQMTLAEFETLLWAYRDRIIDLKHDSRMRYVLIYKNYGALAGATLEHTYSLLMALPIVPRGIIDELEGARKHYGYKERCIYCDIIRQEIQFESRVIAETTTFLAIEPFAPKVAFETWILPKRHIPRFENIEPREIHDLAIIFKEILLRLDKGLNLPDYNYAIHSAPFGNEVDPYYHWHIEIMPRLESRTGLEWGSELYINATPPEDAAKYLRGLLVE
ncbi:MAG: HIT domain-containing protein [Desulfomonilia bacterium]|nr:HIT domain-containing protein [Desulfomonilia bacterium]